MSYQHWELLTRMVTGDAVDLPWVCRELVRQSDAERLFCVVRRRQMLQVVAVDCDGYPLGYAEQRLRDSEFAELAFAAGQPGAAVTITRRISRASKRTAVVGSVQLSPELGLTVILENRFAGKELASLDDQTVEQWVILIALAVRLTGEGALGRPLEQTDSTPTAAHVGSANGGSGLDVASEQEEELDPGDADVQRRETLSALESQRWNISRAARALGMTRHGLKKRMRRLHVARPS